jgi:hypothetical protein
MPATKRSASSRNWPLDVTIPSGSTATIVFPKLQMANPTYSGTLEVGSGTHHFIVKEKE